MTPPAKLAEQLYREQLQRAMRMSGEVKLLAGPRLFEQACRMTLDGIRYQFPDADESQVREILRGRLPLRKKLDELSVGH